MRLARGSAILFGSLEFEAKPIDVVQGRHEVKNEADGELTLAASLHQRVDRFAVT